ncbi:Altered inheritance of mitochondria protein 6 [Talaromyces pinophilus]|nr:Altered inheritance of mitochondria protein 6 [Talaromyces pinophilus]
MQVILATVVSLSCFAHSHAAPHEKRSSNYISSCGTTWMARDDVSSNNGELPRRGYLTAVAEFCEQANGHIVPAGDYLSLATRVFLDGGGDPSTNGIPGYVYFEVHNKQSSASHTVDVNNCTSYLQELSNNNSECWGSEHSDTKGGTWQVGSDAISYHALGESVPPAQDAVDKLYTNGALSTLGGSGTVALSPFPLTFTSDVIPLPCHSHNDYTRDIPLYDALSTGCMSVEADVWLHSGNLRVAHTDPGNSGPTIQDLYINPLLALLDAQNPNGGNRNGVYPQSSSQSLVLLIDFKSDGTTTWDAVYTALQPLRDAGYLSYWYGSEFVSRPITIVASGNAPLAQATNTTANPHHDIFMDSRVNESLDGYDTSNTYYASADFESAITSSGSAPLSSPNQQKLTDQLIAGHAKGFLVRYWDIPSTDLWQELVDAGVDRLNVDDLNAVAGIDFHLSS